MGQSITTEKQTLWVRDNVYLLICKHPLQRGESCETSTWVSWVSSWEYPSVSVGHLPEILESLPESIPVCLWDTYLSFLSLFLKVSQCVCRALTWDSWVSSWEYPSVSVGHLPEILESLPESIPVCLWGTYLRFLSLLLRVFQCVCETHTRVSWVSSWEYPSVSVGHLPEILESLPESIPVCLWDTYLSFLSLFLRVSQCVCGALTWDS
jgi:ABC-type microcin C transport system permease subunit YejB